MSLEIYFGIDDIAEELNLEKIYGMELIIGTSMCYCMGILNAGGDEDELFNAIYEIYVKMGHPYIDNREKHFVKRIGGMLVSLGCEIQIEDDEDKGYDKIRLMNEIDVTDLRRLILGIKMMA